MQRIAQEAAEHTSSDALHLERILCAEEKTQGEIDQAVEPAQGAWRATRVALRLRICADCDISR